MDNGDYSAFMGEHDSNGDPDGIVRMVNPYGNIFEGTITPSGKVNGFCITYIGSKDHIDAGWYQNNSIHGNWMSFNGKDMSVRESGWYEEGKRISDMKNHSKLKKFTISDIFVELL